MAAAGSGGEPHVCLALFKHAHHGKVAVNAADGFRNNAAALITDQIRFHAASFEFCHQFGTAFPAPFLRTGGGQVHVLFRNIPFRQQFFHCLEESHHGALRIRRSPAPDLAVFNVPGKRFMFPGTLRGHHVLVAHQYQRTVVFLSLPVKQQAAVNLCLFQFPVYQGKQFLQHLMKAQELLPLILTGYGHRLIPDHPGQLPGIGFRPFRIRSRLVGGLLSRNQQGTDHRGQHQDQQQADQSQYNPQRNHSAAPFVSRRYFTQARAIASAPAGMIMKLVEDVRLGTSVNRTIITVRGISASSGSFR